MATMPWSAGRLGTTILLGVGGFAGYGALLPWLGRFWGLLFDLGATFLGLPVELGAQRLTFPAGAGLDLPGISVVTPLPDARVLGIAGLATLGVLLASFLLPQRFIPLRYFLRLLVVVQGTAILFFWQSPDPFPYRIADHVFVLLTAGLVVMGLVPLALGLTLHVFDLAFWRKLLLTVLIVAHLAVFVPLNVLVHVWLLLNATAVVMPVLFLVFGLLLNVFVFVAFYGWGLSWRSDSERQELPLPMSAG